MDHLLSLSRAARLVGTSRGEIQQQIQAGNLSTFEGHVRESELMKAYPDVDMEHDGVLQHIENIKENAVHKPNMGELPSADLLAAEVHRLRLKIAEKDTELADYKEFVLEMQDRLTAMQRDCTQHQKILLKALIAWMGHHQRTHHS